MVIMMMMSATNCMSTRSRISFCEVCGEPPCIMFTRPNTSTTATAMTAMGTLAGAAIGNSIGRKLDEEDRRRIREAEMRSYGSPLNEPIVWNNPSNGHAGSITPIRDGRSNTGRYCREFQSEVTVGGERQNAHGTACQEPDGSWRIVLAKRCIA